MDTTLIPLPNQKKEWLWFFLGSVLAIVILYFVITRGYLNEFVDVYNFMFYIWFTIIAIIIGMMIATTLWHKLISLISYLKNKNL